MMKSDFKRLAPERRGTLKLLSALLLVAAVWLPHGQAEAARGIGWIGGTHDMRVEGYLGRGERWANSGSQVYFQFAGAFFGKSSPLGNLAGIEFDMGMGWDGMGYKEKDTLLGDTGFPMHLAIGFPVTLWRLFGRGSDRIQIGFSPGFGINWEVAYTYLKLNTSVRLSRRLAIEGTYTWWPGVASTSVADSNDDVNKSALRGTVYFKAGRRRGGSFLAFAEWMTSQRVSTNASGGNASKTLFDGEDPFGSTSRRRYEGIFRVGFGYAF
ncbi:MAG: hypothetical protein KC502_23855 [Myxococcales bacterium]|nr:hypothetical protein [Myxococcales bacterium]